jgi:hypothetical protein
MTIESLKRISDNSIEVKSVAGDRGCDSKNCKKFITEKKMTNNICPRNPHEHRSSRFLGTPKNSRI